MIDNKYLYFKNLLYVYTTIGYNNMNVFDKNILILTILEILSNGFIINLGTFIDYYMGDYSRILPNIIDDNIPSLKKMCIHKIQNNKINTHTLPKYIKQETETQIWSKRDNGDIMIYYFNMLYNRDKEIFLNYLFIKFNEYKENLPYICDITTLPSTT